MITGYNKRKNGHFYYTGKRSINADAIISNIVLCIEELTANYKHTLILCH